MSDYKQFTRNGDGQIVPTGPRLKTKRATIPLPDLHGKQVLDVGCHSGFWSLLSADLGAARVVAFDQNPVQSPASGHDRVTFLQHRLGLQWHEFGRFDVIYLLSVYHHIYQAAGGDHAPIWYWLSRHLQKDGELLAELAVSAQDHTVYDMVHRTLHANYTIEAILREASPYFFHEYIGHSKHEPHRDVYRFRPLAQTRHTSPALRESGSGMASKLMTYDNGARLTILEHILGWRPVAGTFNLSGQFDWTQHYYRAKIPALVDRKNGVGSAMTPRWVLFYPLTVNGIKAAAMRFEEEYHPATFIEVIAPVMLSEQITGRAVNLTR